MIKNPIVFAISSLLVFATHPVMADFNIGGVKIKAPEIKIEVPKEIPKIAAPPPPTQVQQINNPVQSSGELGKGFSFALVEPGEFTMGSPLTEKRRGPDEAERKIKITKPFEIGTTEITRGVWKKVMGNLPSAIAKDGKSDDFPVSFVSWMDLHGYYQSSKKPNVYSSCEYQKYLSLRDGS